MFLVFLSVSLLWTIDFCLFFFFYYNNCVFLAFRDGNIYAKNTTIKSKVNNKVSIKSFKSMFKCTSCRMTIFCKKPWCRIHKQTKESMILLFLQAPCHISWIISQMMLITDYEDGHADLMHDWRYHLQMVCSVVSCHYLHFWYANAVRPMHSHDASQESHKKSNSQHKLAGCNSAACGHILFVHCKAVKLSTLWRYGRRRGEVINCAVTDRRPRKLLVDHWCASVVTEMVKLTMNGPSFMAAQQKPLGHGVWCNAVTNV